MRQDLSKRLLGLDQILRRSLVIDDNNAYGHPQVNAEVSTALQLRAVLKLLLAKVPRYAHCTREELEELAVRTHLISVPPMSCLLRKDQRLPESEHYILLSGRCVGISVGLETLMNQSLSKLFQRLQKSTNGQSAVPGYRVIRPLVDKIVIPMDGRPSEDILVMPEETAIFGRVSADLKYMAALRALALKKKKVRLRQDKMFAKDEQPFDGSATEEGFHKRQKPRYQDDDYEYLIEKMSPTRSQPLSVFLSARRSPKVLQEHDPDLEIIGTGSDSEDEASADSRSGGQQQAALSHNSSRVRNIIRHYKKLKNRVELASNEVDRSLINNGRKCLLSSVVETFRDGDREFTSRDVDLLYPEKEDDDEFVREFLDFANSEVVPRDDKYLHPAQAAHLKLREFWRRYLAQTNPAAGDSMPSEPLLKLEKTKKGPGGNTKIKEAEPSKVGGPGLASQTGIANSAQGPGGISGRAVKDPHLRIKTGEGGDSPLASGTPGLYSNVHPGGISTLSSRRQPYSVVASSTLSAGGGGSSSSTAGRKRFGGTARANFFSTRGLLSPAGESPVFSRSSQTFHTPNRTRLKDDRGYNSTSNSFSTDDGSSSYADPERAQEFTKLLEKATATTRKIMEKKNANRKNSMTDQYRMRNGQLSVEKFLEESHEIFRKMDDAKKSLLTALFTIKYADKGVELLSQGTDWDSIVAIVGGAVDVFISFEQTQSDQRPFNNYIKEQRLVVSENSSNVLTSAGSGVWFGQAVEDESAQQRKLSATEEAMLTQTLHETNENDKKKRKRKQIVGDDDVQAKPKVSPICPVSVITREETVYLTCPRDAFSMFLKGEGVDKAFHMDRLSWIPSYSVIEKNHTSDLEWNRFKHDSFRDELAEGVDKLEKSYYMSAKPTRMKWFKSEGPGHAYAHVPASSMKVQRAKSAGDVRNLKTHVTHSVMPYASRFLNNRVPPGGGPLMRTSWSGQYMEWLWSTGHDFGHRHSSNLKNGSSIFFNPKASQKGDDKNTTYKWDTKNSMAELYVAADDNPCPPGHVVTRTLGFNA